MSYTGSVPDTRRATDWRDAGSCREEDPELFFPKGYEGPWQLVIEQAKTACRRCPSVDACLQFALDENVGEGIFGGLTADERSKLRRTIARRQLTPDDAVKRADQARKPKDPQSDRPRTLHSIFDDSTARLDGGHLEWTGSKMISFRGRKYTPRQLAFTADRGRYPDGRVFAACGVSDCVLPAHLTDQDERGWHGTRPGYQRHRANGEEACDACRRANTDADNRLRRTGTSKVSA